jgi:hypothetical protein
MIFIGMNQVDAVKVDKTVYLLVAVDRVCESEM